MYAIVKCGGKQLKVAKGDKIVVEKMDAEVGKSVSLGDVLLVSDNGKLTVGTPVVAGAKVMAKVEAQQKGEKVIVFKKRRRQNYRRKNGHRQMETVVVIESISL
ncbi:MAG: 50S ribosomal protein L21 [Alphaproteobacteria bacterium]